MNAILNAIIRFCVKHCHTITCTTFYDIIDKDHSGFLKRHVNN